MSINLLFHCVLVAVLAFLSCTEPTTVEASRRVHEENQHGNTGDGMRIWVTDLDFGEVPVGNSVDGYVRIVNHSDSPVRIESVQPRIIELGLNIALPKLPIVIQPGDQMEFNVGFVPQKAGATIGDIAFNIPGGASGEIDSVCLISGRGK